MSEETKYLVVEATPVDEAGHKNVGTWKSGLCNCFKYGLFHKPLLSAWCCYPLIVGQLLTRMKMTWTGEPSTASEEYKKTFCKVLTIAILQFLIVSSFGCLPESVEETDNGDIIVQNEDCVPWQNNLSSMVSSLFGLYLFIVMVRLRMAIRAKYSIPEENCHGCEDCVSVLFCGCLSAVQMADQTADYENEKAFFFTKTGLSPSKDSNDTTQAIVV